MGIYTITESFNKKNVFLYFAILMILIFYFRDINVGLNSILAIFIAIIVISYLNEKHKLSIELEEKQKQEKLDYILPEPKLFEKYDDLIDLFFSIQELYVYNPQAYEECIDSVNDFLRIKDVIDIGTKNCYDL